VDQYAYSAADRFRAAILGGELDGWHAREARFDRLEAKLSEDSILRKDIQTVRALTWSDFRESPPDSLPTEADKADLAKRHGWFARWITTRDNTAAERDLERQTAADGQRIMSIIFLFGLVVLAAIAAGFVILIIGIVQLLTGKLRPAFRPTPPELGQDRGLWLETFIVFLLGFLVIKGAAALLEHYLGPAPWQGPLALFLQWSLALFIFWPIFRGMSVQRFKGEIGWHPGRGVFAEIRAGILGYLAALPVYFCMALVIVFIMLVGQAVRAAGRAPGSPVPDELPLPDNKVLDLISGAGGLALLLVASLIVIWAPLVEESIFRGALYRHLRHRFRGFLAIPIAVLLVAAAFALVHSYILAGVIMVGTLGAVFSLLREWRGSLIAPMTAHCLHNSTILILLLSLLPALRG
jgi:membrane protease YdiL (CAAX protease family)